MFQRMVRQQVAELFCSNARPGHARAYRTLLAEPRGRPEDEGRDDAFRNLFGLLRIHSAARVFAAVTNCSGNDRLTWCGSAKVASQFCLGYAACCGEPLSRMCRNQPAPPSRRNIRKIEVRNGSKLRSGNAVAESPFDPA